MFWEKQRAITVGEMIEELSKYDRSKPFYATQYHESYTDSGTDMGSSEEHDVEGVYDLESRVVLKVSRWSRK